MYRMFKLFHCSIFLFRSFFILSVSSNIFCLISIFSASLPLLWINCSLSDIHRRCHRHCRSLLFFTIFFLFFFYTSSSLVFLFGIFSILSASSVFTYFISPEFSVKCVDGKSGTETKYRLFYCSMLSGSF